MPRIYFNSSPGDQPREFTHGGKHYAWMPKGEHWDRVKVVQRHIRNPESGKMVPVYKKVYEKTDKPGRPVDFQDLELDAARACMSQRWNADGKLTAKKPEPTPEEIKKEIEYLQSKLDGMKPPEKKGPFGRKIQAEV